MNETLTEKDYWNSTYQNRSSLAPVDFSGARNACAIRILEKKAPYSNDFASVLEIGGGGSAWLAYFALTYPQRQFACLDYSEDGERLLLEFAAKHSLDNLRVFRENFMAPQADVGTYDFVYSHGVVEHFTELEDVLGAHAEFLTESGRMFTLIPNLAGILGPMTRWMNREVYDLHVPHDLDSFLEGHRGAGLKVVEAGYLCSVNFGVLSSCVRKGAGIKWHVYRQLSRLSRVVWWLEAKLGRLPETRTFAPYIFVVSQKLPDQSA